MKQQVFIINGSGGVGKDAFINLVALNFDASIVPKIINVSSVDRVKELAKFAGWDGKRKTEEDRKFLSDLKRLCTDYNDMPFNSMAEEVVKFRNSSSAMLFLHIREPEEIERARKAFDAKTILVKRDSVKDITSNPSDGSVYNYDYDIVIHNNGTLIDLEKLARKFFDDFLNESLKEEY